MQTYYDEIKHDRQAKQQYEIIFNELYCGKTKSEIRRKYCDVLTLDLDSIIEDYEYTEGKAEE